MMKRQLPLYFPIKHHRISFISNKTLIEWMLKMPKTLPVMLPATSALRKLGQDIRNARLRRRISVALMAERANISPNRLHKIEKGDPSVFIGGYASVLFVLGFTDNLRGLADAKNDLTGLMLEEERLPKRIRRSRAEKNEQ
jgi:transcriptional regulator with XRE-family HTH domain